MIGKKINSDAVVFRDQGVRLGVVIRNNREAVMLSSYYRIGVHMELNLLRQRLRYLRWNLL